MSARLFLCVTFVAVASSMLAPPRAEAQVGGQQGAAQSAAAPPGGGVQGVGGAEPCKGSTVCAWSRERNLIAHEFRKPDLGFSFAYPFALPEGGGGVSSVAINSKGQFTESTYMAMDAQGNLYVGDTGAPRITMMVASGR